VNKADMRVATRLSLGFGLVLLLMVLLVAAGLFRFDQVGTISSRIVDQDWAKVEAVNTINSITRANARNTLELFITADAAQAAKIYQRIDAMLMSRAGCWYACQLWLEIGRRCGPAADGFD